MRQVDGQGIYASLCKCINEGNLATTKQVKRYVYPVQLDEEELAALDVILEKQGGTKSEAIKEAIRSYAEELRGLEVVKIRDIPRAQARREIVEFLDKKERAWASEIADALRVDLSLVNRVLEGLWAEKRVEPAT